MVHTTHRYFVINKPCNMVSQFISTHSVPLLGNLDFDFPDGTHAIGRLDSNSEGLLLLTTNKKITRLLFSGSNPHKRTYLVQLNNIVTEEKINQLRTGVSIRVKGGAAYITPACTVTLVLDPFVLYSHGSCLPQYGPHTWLLITLSEGKFHQVRKMVAAIRHRCKRLIRIAIEDLSLGGLAPGCVLEMGENDFFNLLNIGKPG